MFAAPAFLAALLAIGLPLWLHRMASEDRVRQKFPSLMLLERSEVQRTSKRSLRYLLLLALRIALLVLLALTFAQPLLPEKVTPGESSDARLHVIVLDSSLSMQYAKRWDAAIEQAESILAGLHGSDRVMLVTAAGRNVRVIGEMVPATRAGELKAALKSLKPSLSRLDYGMVMTTAQSWLTPQSLPVEMHLITDLQQSASPQRFSDLAVPGAAHLQIHDIGKQQSSVNAWIENVEWPMADGKTLSAIVRGQLSPATRHEVVLTIDGKERGRKSVAIDKANRSQVLFPLQLEPGTHRIEAALEPHDDLPQDDRFFAVVEHTTPSVLIVSRDTKGDDSAYLASAIASQTSPRLTVDQGTAQLTGIPSLTRYSALVISDAGVLSEEAARKITDYLSGGGRALMTLGPRTLGASNRLLANLRARATTDDGERVAGLDESHPMLRDSKDWRNVRFFRHFVVELQPEDRTLISLGDGSPLLVERRIGAGRLLILTSPLEREWNDLAIHPLFVRFIAEASRYLTKSDAAAASTVVGNNVTTGLTDSASGQIFDPQGRRALALGETGNAARIVPGEIGFYEIRSANSVRWLAVNTDKRESELDHMTDEAVQRWMGLHSASNTATTAKASDGSERRPAGLWLLPILAALIFLEFLMANRHLSVRREVLT